MRLTAGLLALGLVLATPALAQTQAPSPQDQRPMPQTGTATPLGTELSRTDGVVHPSSRIDPGMSQTPPDPGARSTPMIKPPTPESGVTPK